MESAYAKPLPLDFIKLVTKTIRMDTKDRIAKTQKQAHARYWLIVSLGFFLTMDRSLFIECIQREGSLFVIVQIIIGAVGYATTFDFHSFQVSQRNFNFGTMER